MNCYSYCIKILPTKINSEWSEECIGFTKYLSIKRFQPPSLFVVGFWYKIGFSYIEVQKHCKYVVKIDFISVSTFKC